MGTGRFAQHTKAGGGLLATLKDLPTLAGEQYRVAASEVVPVRTSPIHQCPTSLLLTSGICSTRGRTSCLPADLNSLLNTSFIAGRFGPRLTGRVFPPAEQLVPVRVALRHRPSRPSDPRRSHKMKPQNEGTVNKQCGPRRSENIE